MAKKKKEDQTEDQEILTSVEARRKFKEENPDEPDHPGGSKEAREAAKAVTASLTPPAPQSTDSGKTK